MEELSLNAWPALQTLLYDGWVLRFANGYTRRANSVNPLYASTLDVNEKIGACEQLYRRKGLKTVFKMTAHSTPMGLDELLVEKDYQADAHTSVQLLGLGDFSVTSSASIELAEDPADSWLAAYCRMSSVDATSRATLEQILRLIVPDRRFASITVAGQVIACGLGVLQNGYISLCNIATDPDLRRRGYARQILDGLLAWGKDGGAQRACLQVMLNNPPAMALYASLGFREIYQYWYRVGPEAAT
jgi:N-acetylglutamate synthase